MIIDQVKTGVDKIEREVQLSIDSEKMKLERLEYKDLYRMMVTPKTTIEKVYRVNSSIVLPFLFIGCAGAVRAFNESVIRSNADFSFFEALITNVGEVYLYSLILCFLIFVSGKLFGGKGSFRKVLLAWGWSFVPMIFVLLLWLIKIAFLGNGLIYGGVTVSFESGLLIRSLNYMTLFGALLMIWQSCLLLVAISTAQKFSKWKAFFSILSIFLALSLYVALV